MPKSIADTVRDLENTLAAKNLAMQEIMQKASEDGRTLDDAEAEEFETLETERDQVQKDLARWRKINTEAQAAAPVTPPASGDQKKAAATTRTGAPAIIVNKQPDEEFQGQFFVQKLVAQTLARLDGGSASAIAHRRYVKQAWRGRQNPILVDVIKANEVAGGAEASGEWGAELVAADGRYTGDFITYLYGMTVFDRLPLREVPANVIIKGQDGAGTGYWTGEGLAIDATAPSFSTVTLTPLKVGAIAACSKELLRDSSPSAELWIRDSLVQAIAQKIDTTFVGTGAASSGVSPAGILNGVSAGTTAGGTGSDLRYDINTLYANFITAKNASGLYFVMNPAMAKGIQLITNSLSLPEFPNIRANGGDLLGDPVVTGDNATSTNLILLKPSDIFKIGDMGIQVSMSDQATLEMSSAAQGDSLTPTAASANLQNMFQQEMVAFKVVRPMNWAKRRSTAVQYISSAAYAPTTT